MPQWTEKGITWSAWSQQHLGDGHVELEDGLVINRAKVTVTVLVRITFVKVTFLATLDGTPVCTWFDGRKAVIYSKDPPALRFANEIGPEKAREWMRARIIKILESGEVK